ncbi:MAG: IS256 family transposase [Lentisphaerae bacterium]|nr:IS256 family transposase [Lentisphaerota bacterium]
MDTRVLLRQVGLDRISDIGATTFRDFVRDAMREMIARVMAEEVHQLCGARYRPETGARRYRAGSSPGYVLHDGQRMEVVRPRVRERTPAEATTEVKLATYEAAQDPTVLQGHLLEALRCGVSSREQKRLRGDRTPGTSRSEVSRLWLAEGKRLLGEFRSRRIERDDWLALLLDGLALGGDLLAVVALGIAADGTKMLLDFEIGASENAEVAKGLLARLQARNFRPAAGCRLLSVLDGSDALKQAVVAYWPEAVTQRCLVHKERNLRRYLPKRHWGELAGLFDRLRKAQGEKAGREALRAIEAFLADKNAAALASFHEAGEDLIAVHKLEVPATLNGSLLSTNLIENPFRNVRRKIGRVTRWRAETDQPSRWLSYALLEAERGFRRIRHHGDLPQLAAALKRKECAAAG